MKSKKINIAQFRYIALFVIFTLFSCESMIEEQKYDFIQDSDIEDSDAGADQWVTGVYSKLSDDMFRYDMFPSVLEFDCDYMSGPDWSFGTFGAGNFQGSEHTQTMWEGFYNLIHRASYALENIEKMSNLSEAHKANVMGELYFLKGYSYFMLVRAFGEIPIRRHSVNLGLENENQPKQAIPDVYAHIIELLSYAQDNMYKNTDEAFVEGHASAGAAAAFLAKTYLTIASASLAPTEVRVKGGKPFSWDNEGNLVFDNYTVQTFVKEQVAGYESFNSKEYFKLAMDKAKQVIDGAYGTYALLPFSDIWTQASKNKVEHIWSLQTLSGSEKYGTQFSQSYCGTFDGNDVIINGKWWGLRDHWYRLFESKDLRIKEGVMHRWVKQGYHTPSWNGGAVYPSYGEWWEKSQNGEAPYDDGRTYVNDKGSEYLAFLTKYADVTDNTIARQDANWPFMRFADVLLIYAEAANEYNGAPSQEALDALNKVRERSEATDKVLSGNGSIGDLVSFRSAVLEERAMELALEGDRRWDLIRWGIYLQTMNGIGGYDEVNVNKARLKKHLLFPIPTTEMNANNAINENNYGW
ncbi:MAG: RagB/SusD family nutrient uptake outer membrane protein [Bacteroidales bacterium]